MADYVALRRLNVQELDSGGEPLLDEGGTPKVRVCEPGDPIPEAIHWPNLEKWIRMKRVGLPGTVLPGGGKAASARSRRARRKSAAAKRGAGAQSAEPEPSGESSAPKDPPGEANAQEPDEGAQAEA